MLRERLVATLQDLVRIPSAHPPGDCGAICDYLERRLREAGARPERLRRAPGADNVVVRFGSGAPQLAFCSHVDTVHPGDRAHWQRDPFGGAVADGKVWGVGASNCKAATAVHLCMAEHFARSAAPARGEVVFAFCSDEENLGPNGALFLKEQGALRPDWLVVGGNTGNQLVLEERGVLWVRVAAKGHPAHAGEPHAGDNAILRLTRILARLSPLLDAALLRRAQDGMRSTVNVGVIAGGCNANVVPEHCHAILDRRLLPEETVEAACEEIRTLVAQCGEPADSVAVEKLLGTNGFRASREGRCARAVADAIAAELGRPAQVLSSAGASDGRYFTGAGAEVVGFGPGDPGQGHARDEFVPIDALESAARIQLLLVRELLGP